MREKKWYKWKLSDGMQIVLGTTTGDTIRRIQSVQCSKYIQRTLNYHNFPLISFFFYFSQSPVCHSTLPFSFSLVLLLSHSFACPASLCKRFVCDFAFALFCCVQSCTLLNRNLISIFNHFLQLLHAYAWNNRFDVIDDERTYVFAWQQSTRIHVCGSIFVYRVHFSLCANGLDDKATAEKIAETCNSSLHAHTHMHWTYNYVVLSDTPKRFRRQMRPIKWKKERDSKKRHSNDTRPKSTTDGYVSVLKW